MSRFYTNISISGSNVLVREIVDGIPNMRKDQWCPTIYVNGKPKATTSKFTALDGHQVYSMQPGSIPECKDFVEQYKDVDGFEIFGQLNYSLQYMNEYKPTAWQYKLIQSWAIDIETASAIDEQGVSSFPDPKNAQGEIKLITLINMHTGDKFTFGDAPYSGNDTRYTNGGNEFTMLKLFIQFWESKKIDIITGWHILGFDIPYLYNRIVKVLGEEWVKKLSPWGKVFCKVRNFQGKEEFSVTIAGISILDYLDLYKKYVFTPQESYSLQHIAMSELGHTKLDHSKWKTFDEFWQNDWKSFVAYNCVDAELVKQLDDKLNLIGIVLTMAYDAKINYEDVSSPVKLWDAITANHCLDQGIAVPQGKHQVAQQLDGAYVKDPILGWHKSIVSLDATSLYPSIIMTNNIGPDTYVGNNGMTIDEFLAGKTSPENRSYVVTPAGAIYSRDKQGIMAQLVEKYMALRRKAKKEMLQLEQEYEDTKDKSLKARIAALDNLQMAYKIAMNSLYGAMANAHFRFYQHDHASSITLTGQYVLRSIEYRIDMALNELFKTENENYLIYIDTDSLYFSLQPVIEKFGIADDRVIGILEKTTLDKIVPIVNKICTECCEKMGSFSNKLFFKLEIAADKGFWLGKKKYVVRAHSSEGVTYSKPKFKVKGLEMVRSSTPQFVRTELKKSLDIVFDTDEKTVQKFVEDVRGRFMQLPYGDVAFPRGANNLDEYSDDRMIYKKACPLQVRGVLLYNHYLRTMKLDNKYPIIGEGSKIRFCYLKKPNKLKENVIAWPVDGELPVEFGVHDKVDYELQYEKTFLASMEIVLDAIKWSAVEHSSLDEFFG